MTIEILGIQRSSYSDKIAVVQVMENAVVRKVELNINPDVPEGPRLADFKKRYQLIKDKEAAEATGTLDVQALSVKLKAELEK